MNENNFSSNIAFAQPFSLKVQKSQTLIFFSNFPLTSPLNSCQTILRISMNSYPLFFLLFDPLYEQGNYFLLTLASSYFYQLGLIVSYPPYHDSSVDNFVMGCQIPKFVISVFMVLTVVFDFGGNQSGALLVGIAAFVAIKVLINVLRVEIMLFFIMLMWFYVFLYVSMFGIEKLIKL
jgi:hypothetical protein